MSWIQNAKVGDKIACVTRQLWDTSKVDGLPVVGSVYTIESIGKFWTAREGGAREEVGITLKETKAHPIGYPEVWYWLQAKCFAPVKFHKTDISIFQRMLNTAPAKVGEIA